MKNKIIYLWIRTVVALYILVGIFALVATTARDFYAESSVLLPKLTQTVINIGDFIVNYWKFLSVITVVVLLICLTFFYKTSIGRRISTQLSAFFRPLAKMDKLIISDIKYLISLTIIVVILYSLILPLFYIGATIT